jgi:HEPN domain-containing protein
MESRARDWLAQAENDLRWAADSARAGHYGGACFIAQQVAEKALKAIGYFRGADLVRGHSALEITRALEINGPLRHAAARLDQYYITTRYPDSVPQGAPFEFFSQSQADEALNFARLFLDCARGELGS